MSETCINLILYPLKHYNIFCNYFVLKKKKLLVLINGQTKRRIIHKLNKLAKNPPENYQSVLASYKGYLSNCCSGSFIRKHSWFDGIDMKVKRKDAVIVVE